MTNGPIQVNSEIGKLKTVLLKRPGKELENLVPDYLDGLLFDDIPFLKVAQQEHDHFAQVLQDEGIEVLYLEKLAAQSIEDSNVREQFIDDVLAESRKTILGHEKEIKKLFSTLSNQALINKIMAGVRKEEIQLESTHLVEYMDDKYPFYLDPMPNLYFTRDPQASIGRGMTVNRMFWRARRRESIFISYILKHHPRFKDEYIFTIFAMPVGNYFKGGLVPTNFLIQDEYDRAAPHGTGAAKVGGNYAASMLPGKIAHDRNFSDVIYLDPATHTKIEEVGSANFFGITANNEFVTPLSPSILPSITKYSLLYLAEHHLGMTPIEGDVFINDLDRFVEAGACGTAAVISPIGGVQHGDDFHVFYSETEVGPFTGSFMSGGR